MTISELEIIVKTTGLVGFETQLGYVVFPVNYINQSTIEWLVNVVGDTILVRNVRYSKQLHKILYSTNYQSSIDKIDPKAFELELVELITKWNKLNKRQENDAMLEQLKEDFV